MKDLTFEEIFNQDGLYVADGFASGTCFEIKNGVLYLLHYRHKDDLSPERTLFSVYKGLFCKKYRQVFTRQSLFTS